jgi:hypothetical protein
MSAFKTSWRKGLPVVKTIYTYGFVLPLGNAQGKTSWHKGLPVVKTIYTYGFHELFLKYEAETPSGTKSFTYFKYSVIVRVFIYTLKDAAKWVSDCCLTPSQQLFSYIMARTNSFSMIWWYRQCTRPTRIFIVLAHWSNSPRIDMSPHSLA